MRTTIENHQGVGTNTATYQVDEYTAKYINMLEKEVERLKQKQG